MAVFIYSLLALVLGAVTAAGPSRAQGLDLQLVLAVDSSASVTWDEFNLQMEGLATAFENAEIQKIIHDGANGAIAVSMIEWSGFSQQRTTIPWMIIDSEASARRLAALIRETPRFFERGGTSISGAISYGLQQIAGAPFSAVRRVIDISGDGRNSSGPDPGGPRAMAQAAGVVINGLAIVNEEPDLREYFERSVISGPGAFAVSAADYNAYRKAIRDKLAREVRGQWFGVSLPAGSGIALGTLTDGRYGAGHPVPYLVPNH